MNRQKRQNERRRQSGQRRNTLRVMTVLLVIFFLLAGYARYIEPRALVRKEESYSSAKLTVLHDDIKIAIFADTHFSEYYTPEDFQKAVNRINSEEPDFIFFLGDLIDDYSSYPGDINEVIDALASLKAKRGKFAVFGNHDYGGEMEFDYPDVLEAGGFQLLVNEAAFFDDLGLSILGIDDMLIGYGDPASASVLTEDHYNIIICHEPDVADQLKDYCADLMLAGHTHGRQINCKPLDGYILPPYGKNYIKGSYSLETSDGSGMELYVTGGIGTTKLPLRLASPPEVNIITLEKFTES